MIEDIRRSFAGTVEMSNKDVLLVWLIGLCLGLVLGRTWELREMMEYMTW